jgi:hypothetical protein
VVKSPLLRHGMEQGRDLNMNSCKLQSDPAPSDMHALELREDWELAQAGKEIKKIAPLD